MNFLQTLLTLGILDQVQANSVVATANEKYNGDIDLALVAVGVDEKAILSAKAQYFNLPTRDALPKTVPYEVLKLIPEDSARTYKFVPLAMADGVLEVGIVNPENMQAADALQFITSKLNIPFKYFLIAQTAFDEIINNYKGLSGSVDQAVSAIDSDIGAIDTSGIGEEDMATLAKNAKATSDEEKIVEDAPIIKIVAVILQHATEGNASDIHIETTGSNVKVRFRVDGTLHTSLVLPMNVYSGIVARIKILSKLRLDEKRKPQDGSFSTKIDERKIDFRVSTFPTYYGEKVVMRILDSEKGVKPLDSIDFSPKDLATVRATLSRPYGIILITGPTGSGKSTTLYSMLNELDKEKINVVSLEDPVEYHMPGINQSQVLPEIGYTFASGLRSILRQDPDVIMVGEIRDKETAQLAIQAALTGHLVLATLHTNTAIGAIPRLVDMGVDPYLIAPTLLMTMAQRLARRIGPNSKSQKPMDEATRTYIDKQFADLPEEFKSTLGIGNDMYEAVPSPDCALGTRGRMAVFEVFSIDAEIQRMILTNPVEQELYKIARKQGMLTMREDAILKSLRGDIPFQEVYGL